jgi:hypothetical protein
MRHRLPALALLLATAAFARVDEGMWTFDNLPLKKMKEKYGFAPDQAWLDHVRLSAVRFPGGSGSFVSKDGLVLTNHHVGRGWIQRVSGPGEKNYLVNGFVAGSREAEIKVPGLELYTLMSMENVTARVEAAAKASGKGAKGARPSAQDALKARQAELTKIVDEEHKKTGLECQPVTLYQGGEFWIYRYKKHTDVRLVMAPEQQVAFFGGDADNFTYPRHDVDFSLFRVYEDGKPYQTPHHLQWTKTGLKNGDLTFVTGHPGNTSRLFTLAQMAYMRDSVLPVRIKAFEEQVAVLKAYGAKSEANMLKVNAQIFSIENTLKALRGHLKGLKDPEQMDLVAKKEKELKAAVAKDPKLAAEAGQSWAKIDAAMQAAKGMVKEQLFLNTRGSQLLANALTIVRLADESAKPADKRLAEFQSDAQIEQMKKRLTMPSQAPFDQELEILQFAYGLKEAEAQLGAQHPFVKAALAGRTPEAAAKALVEGSKLSDAAARKALIEGGKAAVAGSDDPMIKLARVLDPLGRAFRKKQEDQFAAVITEHLGRLARARFAVYGKEAYPDATFTLRLTYGPVATYPANGTLTQPFTTLAGLFDRAWGWGPEAEHGWWALPKRWMDKQPGLAMNTPLGFAHAVDIIGGNSGSPVVDKHGELVGLIYDGNIESLPGNYYYDGKVNRGVSLDARAILEVLDKVFEAKDLVTELKGN